MNRSNRIQWHEDFYGQIGRGITFLLALTLPFIGKLDAVPLSGGRELPVVSLLSLLIPLFALAGIARGDRRSPYGRTVLTIALIIGVIAGLGGRLLGNDPVLAMASIWEPALLVAGVAMLFTGHSTERIGLYAALIVSTLLAILLGLAELVHIPGVRSLLEFIRGVPESWQLVARVTGPLPNADSMSWFAAVLLPILGAATLTIEGKLRDVLLLVIGIFWLGALLTLSYGAPIAALAGLLVVLTGHAKLRKSLSGAAVPLLIGLAIALLYPGFRARWGPYDEPVAFTVQELTTVEGGAAPDSLHVVFANKGPITWESGFETGFHILYPENPRSQNSLRMFRGGWVSEPIQEPVASGEQVAVSLPFSALEQDGFLVLDLKGPGGHFTEYRISPYLLLFSADSDGERRHLNRLMQIKSPEYVIAANQAVQPRQSRHPPPMFEIWTDSYGLMSARPWLGLGPGATERLLGFNARNVFIETVVSAGWIGLAGLIVFILVLNIGLLTRATLEAYALSGVLFAMVLHGFSAYVYSDLSARTAAMILIGAAWAVGFGRKEQKESEQD